MPVLGIDTAERTGVVFIGENGTPKVRRTLDPRMASTSLIPAVAELLQQIHREFREVEYVVVGLGPGSYTGLRVGVSLAKALAWSADIPVVGVPTLECLAATVASAPVICPLLQAYQDKVYASWYRNEGSLVRRESDYVFWSRTDLYDAVAQRAPQEVVVVPSQLVEAEWLRPDSLPGNGKVVFHPLGRETAHLRLAEKRLADNAPGDVTSVNPIYYSPPVS